MEEERYGNGTAAVFCAAMRCHRRVQAARHLEHSYLPPTQWRSCRNKLLQKQATGKKEKRNRKHTERAVAHCCVLHLQVTTEGICPTQQQLPLRHLALSILLHLWHALQAELCDGQRGAHSATHGKVVRRCKKRTRYGLGEAVALYNGCTHRDLKKLLDVRGQRGATGDDNAHHAAEPCLHL